MEPPLLGSRIGAKTAGLHHSSQQCRILNPLTEARIKPTSSWILVGFLTTKPQWELAVSLFSMSEGFLNIFNLMIQDHRLLLFVVVVLSFLVTPAAYGGSQARVQIRAIAGGLHHSHSNTASELHLRPIAQLMAMPDP